MVILIHFGQKLMHRISSQYFLQSKVYGCQLGLGEVDETGRLELQGVPHKRHQLLSLSPLLPSCRVEPWHAHQIVQQSLLQEDVPGDGALQKVGETEDATLDASPVCGWVRGWVHKIKQVLIIVFIIDSIFPTKKNKLCFIFIA